MPPPLQQLVGVALRVPGWRIDPCGPAVRRLPSIALELAMTGPDSDFSEEGSALSPPGDRGWAAPSEFGSDRESATIEWRERGSGQG
jgi:hypothetical protein